jgi:hypothetical protein
MTIELNALAEAKRTFENPVPSGSSLTRAVAVLVRGGATEREARGWASDAVRDYGLPLDHHGEFDRIIQRGLALARPPEAEEPEESEPPPELPIDVQPSNLGGLALPPVAGLSPDELLRIATNPEATKKRYCKLQKQQAAAAKATEDLAAAVADFEARVERTQAALAAESATLQKNKIALFAEKAAFEETAERARNIIAEQNRIANIGRFEQVGPTLVREFVPGYPTGRETEDAHYPPSSALATGSTLTREPARRPPRSMRRVSQEP